MDSGVELNGVFMLSFARACMNLKIVAGGEPAELATASPDAWYPAEDFTRTLARMDRRYPDFEPIKEQLGIEMMKLWYELGPGRDIVRRGVDFLHHQISSAGYHSMVRGPSERIGAFTLEHLDEVRGEARIRSTTPFDRSMERGVLLGGVRLAGDVDYVAIENTPDPSLFALTFH